MQRQLDRLPGTGVSAFVAGHAIILRQGSGVGDVDQVASLITDGHLGVGLVRTGLASASLSIREAQLAVAGTHPESRVTHWGTDWLVGSLVSLQEHLQPLSADAVATAADHAHLAQTVEAYSRCNMSVAATATEIRLHPNTVTYRLERWHALSGVNPRTFEGPALSVVACRVAAQQGRDPL